jgi:hypothetical protein
MRFSWKSGLLAPFPVPAICCAVLGVLQSDHPVLAFLITLVPASIISYGTMFVLFLPCLYILSLSQPLTGLKVCLVGLVLGTAVHVLVMLMMWKSSGTDSGPPDEPFFTFFVRFSADPLTAVFPLAGLLTAALYWWLGARPHSRPVAVQE